MIDFYNDFFNDVSGKYYSANDVCTAHKSTKMQIPLQQHQAVDLNHCDRQTKRETSFHDNNIPRHMADNVHLTFTVNLLFPALIGFVRAVVKFLIYPRSQNYVIRVMNTRH